MQDRYVWRNAVNLVTGVHLNNHFDISGDVYPFAAAAP